MTAMVNVTATTGGNLNLTPVTTPNTTLLSIKIGSATTNCTYVSAVPATGGITIPVQTGGGNGGGTDGDDVVLYDCDVTDPANTDTNYPADIYVKVALSTPTATVNTDATLTWTGTIQSTGDPLVIPSGFPTTGAKVFVTVKATGAGVPTAPSGEATLSNVTVGATLAALPNVTLKVKPTTTGTVSLTAGDLAFGTTGSLLLKCAAPTTGLKTYSFTVASATSTSTSSNSPSPTTTSPRPTTTRTSTVTITPSRSTTTRKSTTPKAGADTGAGGTMGPDGRLFILTGTALVGAAAVGGLVMRRRSIKG
ncbi:hypothetical protein HCN51_51975 [Nonomuraea sp. FMUSA5-5]|uniref:LPXTG cell wall anchor domain-containing protein n=1 Tax=Nonomuraea composti TaxID=2720023 RepID=A0ABX1BRI0_9ACTN|nr:hypothetical protein [Nonomuraea sp. FMUSA5-5]NJP97851.1 hypothetical protein [Nonomuraea sp. FMUSA5-5]